MNGMMERSGARRLPAMIAAAATTGAVLMTAAPVWAAAEEADTLIAFEWSGLSEAIRSPKDDGLKRAFSMMPDRLMELRSQVPDLQQIPEEMMQLGMSIFSSPMRMAVTSKAAPGFDGLGAIIRFDLEDRDAAQALHNTLSMMMQQGMGLPEPEKSRRFDGLSEAMLPGGGPLTFGPSEGDDGWRYDLIFGAIDNPERSFSGLPNAGRGFDSAFRATMDLGAMDPFISMVMPMAAPFMPPGVSDQLRNQGLLGPEAMSFEVVDGYMGDRAVTEFVVRDMKKYAAAMGVSQEPLTARDLAVIPSDVYAVQVKNSDTSAMLDQFEQAMAMAGGAEEISAQVEEALGVSLKQLFDAFGDTSVAYISDQTGGNTIMAGVMLWELKDASTVRTALGNAGDLINEMIRAEMQREGVPGTIQLDRRVIEGVEYHQLRAPGLPLPVQPTMAVTDDWFIFGATPQACHGAVMQARTLRGGLTENEAFSNNLWDVPNRPTSISFVDYARTLDDGYGTICMFCSSLVNFVRSQDGERDPGMIVPTLSSLRDGAAPMISVSYFVEDDLFTQSRTDTSLLVNAAGLLGTGDLMPLIAGGFIGSAITAEAMEGQRYDTEWEDWDEGDWEEAPADDMHDDDDHGDDIDY